MSIDLTGLTARPSQVWGGVRLVPLVRDEPVPGLRLAPETYDEGLGVVQVGPRAAYVSYIPHAFVLNFGAGPEAVYGTHLDQPGESRPPGRARLRFHRRMARRVDKDRLRFLPLHLALEGYLALHFGGPATRWQEWSDRAIRNGLSPRCEESYTGAAVQGLDEALRVFEIHPGQCGVLVYAADALATAFVVPHPDDYRVLHDTLLLDLFGELIYHYALLSAPVPAFGARIDDAGVRTLADLRARAAAQTAAWTDFHDGVMSRGLLAGEYTHQHVHEVGEFRLSRFLPSFARGRENHLGEIVTDGAGRAAYLKTYRLSEQQVRRGHLLAALARNDWHVEDTAAELGTDAAQLGLRLERAGFGSLIRQDVMDGYRARVRRGR
ncbi:hypothetical protein DPM19_03740 [Actinomadura craniellae]|uniref:ARG and Rhodanese-Phosphatase-superfamily-associated domain-containing protein n=1 Tax=Actinomadura craniellae TaxID=2231787 RepID=A0A365HAM6_9ACTN|nr:hypothetical protein [Actinomadura craniellae]RAY16058.1 hypothetical protein DPM19_03740 [Actinomadura craniellae]